MIRYSPIRTLSCFRGLSGILTGLLLCATVGCGIRSVDPLVDDQRGESGGDDSGEISRDSAEESDPGDDSDSDGPVVPDDTITGACGPSTRDDFELVDQPGAGLRNGDVRRVGHIIDGDTLDVIVDGRGVKVRLKGMNTPECDKAPDRNRRYRCVRDDEGFGLAAYEAVFEIAEDATVRITCDQAEDGEECELDVYDRYLAYIEVPCVGDVGEALVGQGLALTFTRYESEKLADYCVAEYAARASRAGFWEGGSITSMLNLMSDGTRSWYRYHDARCDAAIEELENASP